MRGYLAGNESIPDPVVFKAEGGERNYSFGKDNLIFPNDDRSDYDRLDRHVEAMGRYSEIFEARDFEGEEFVLKILRPERYEISGYNTTVGGNEEASG